MGKKLIVFGTRPEFLKLLPVFMEIKKQRKEENYCCLFTGQHLDLTRDLFRQFNFTPDYSIYSLLHDNSLSYSFAEILSGIQNVIDEIQKSAGLSMIIGQGDTTSCVCSAMCAFFNEIPFVHIEAGLRTHDIKNPYPEEYFRRIISLSTTIHFAPTEKALQNLLEEGINRDKIIITANTIVDTIGIIKSMIAETGHRSIDDIPSDLKRNIIISCHRRENQNSRYHVLIDTIKVLANENPSFNFLWLSHSTPFVKAELKNSVFEHEPNIHIFEPMGAMELYKQYLTSKLIITDSGGIQEEAASFNIPVLVIRDKTERIESTSLGYSILTGINRDQIIQSFYQLLNLGEIEMKNPYGDGKASERIINYLDSIPGSGNGC
jgi:UDP-N-acetylglucosamine 2-epimerase (non-hydrolysing)